MFYLNAAGCLLDAFDRQHFWGGFLEQLGQRRHDLGCAKTAVAKREQSTGSQTIEYLLLIKPL